jgi:ABC-type Fe3+/spermidine/putrescine transport system ATPase subunit
VALREETRGELRELVTKLGLTAVYVTHDQEEAFALCDRISVMSEGRALQTGVPRDLYERPQLITVARFLGRNNLITVRRLSSSDEERGKFKTIDGEHTLVVAHVERGQLGPLNKNCTLSVRPEHLLLSRDAPGRVENVLTATIKEINFEGATTTVRLDARGLKLEALLLSPDGFSVGDACSVEIPPDKITLLGARE